MQDNLNPDGTRKEKPIYTVSEYFNVVEQLDAANEMLATAAAEIDGLHEYYAGGEYTTGNDSPASLTYVHAKDIEVDFDQADFVQGILGHGQLSVIYGESNCGKTFFMTDLCFHIALGQAWRERRVDQGGVVYVAMEGSLGLKKRVSAFRAHYNKNPDGFVMVPSHVDFMDPEGNITEFIDLLGKAREDLGSIRIVVIDTLARAISGGDENSGQDMGMLVKHADLIRAKTGAHVCFIHHSGKDKLKGARGHSSLRAAVDTEIEISREDGADFSRVRVVKQREMELGQEMAFKLESVTLGINKYDEPITSCVVKNYEVDDKPKRKPKDFLTPGQRFVYDAILAAMLDEGKEVRPYPGMVPVKSISYESLFKYLDRAGYKEFLKLEDEIDQGIVARKTKTTTYTTRTALQTKGLIYSNNNWIWLADFTE